MELMDITFVVFVLSFLKSGYCQSWITKTDRIAYVQENGQLNISWKFNAQDFKLIYARWELTKEDGTPKNLIVGVNINNEISTFDPTVLSPTLGDVRFLKLDKTEHKKITISILLESKTEGDKDFVTLVDTLTIEYIDIVAHFTTSLPYPSLQVIEESNDSKNRELTVTAKGKPKPTVSWKLNGINTNTTEIPGFSIEETEAIELDNVYVITSKLKMVALEAKHNGKLTVTTFYGNDENLSANEQEEMLLDIQFAPKNISFHSNITGVVLLDEGYVDLRCKSYANPMAIYTISETSNVVYEGPNTYYTMFIPKDHHTKDIMFRCIAKNDLGEIDHSFGITVLNSTLIGRRQDDDETKWWVYYAVGVGIGVVIFIGVAITVMFIRSRMRSMDIRSDVNKVKMKSIKTGEDYERKAMRHNGTNHVYDLNQRGAPDGVNVKSGNNQNGSINGVENHTFDIHDDLEAYKIN